MKSNHVVRNSATFLLDDIKSHLISIEYGEILLSQSWLAMESIVFHLVKDREPAERHGCGASRHVLSKATSIMFQLEIPPPWMGGAGPVPRTAGPPHLPLSGPSASLELQPRAGDDAGVVVRKTP